MITQSFVFKFYNVSTWAKCCSGVSSRFKSITSETIIKRWYADFNRGCGDTDGWVARGENSKKYQEYSFEWWKSVLAWVNILNEEVLTLYII